MSLAELERSEQLAARRDPGAVDALRRFLAGAPSDQGDDSEH